MEIEREIFVSLITSIITWVALTFGKTIIIPFYERLVYKGVSIQGIWSQNIKYDMGTPNQIEYTETINITQKANKITGIYTVTNIIPGQKTTTAIYTIQGSIINGYVTFKGEISNNKVGICSFLLRVTSGGAIMIGSNIFIDQNIDGISAYPDQTYTRQS